MYYTIGLWAAIEEIIVKVFEQKYHFHKLQTTNLKFHYIKYMVHILSKLSKPACMNCNMCL